MGIPRDGSFSTDRVGLLATAEAEAVRWLNQHAGPERRVTVTVRVPSTHVNAAYAGQELDMTFSHVPGLETGATGRIRSRTAIPVGPGWWDLRLVVWLPRATADDAAVSEGCLVGAAFAALLDSNGSSAPGLTFYRTGDTPDPGWYPEPSVSSLLTFVQGSEPYTQIESHEQMTVRIEAQVDFSVVVGGDFSVTVAATVDGITVGSDTYSSSGGLRFESHLMVVDVTDVEVQDGSIIELTNNQPSIFWDGFGNNGTYLRVGRGTFSWNSGAVTWSGPDITVPIDCGDEPLPAAGSLVAEAAAGATDASNTDYATSSGHGWLAGSLRVLHDGFDQTDHVVTQDPEAGTFSLDYAPSAGSTITVLYLAA
jgi:hypothetical protein